MPIQINSNFKHVETNYPNKTFKKKTSVSAPPICPYSFNIHIHTTTRIFHIDN